MRYIVDIPEGYIPVRAKDKSLVFPGNPRFRTYEKELEDIRKNQYVILQHDVEEALRNEGREEAWDLARKIMNMGAEQRVDAFGDTYLLNITKSGYSEVSKKYNEWRKKISVGDIVIVRDEGRAIITDVTTDFCEEGELSCNCLFVDGASAYYSTDNLVKTDEHIDLSDIFTKLKGGSE